MLFVLHKEEVVKLSVVFYYHYPVQDAGVNVLGINRDVNKAVLDVGIVKVV